MDGTVIFLRLIRRISYPSFVQPTPGSSMVRASHRSSEICRLTTNLMQIWSFIYLWMIYIYFGVFPFHYNKVIIPYRLYANYVIFQSVLIFVVLFRPSVSISIHLVKTSDTGFWTFRTLVKASFSQPLKRLFTLYMVVRIQVKMHFVVAVRSLSLMNVLPCFSSRTRAQ